MKKQNEEIDKEKGKISVKRLLVDDEEVEEKNTAKSQIGEEECEADGIQQKMDEME